MSATAKSRLQFASKKKAGHGNGPSAEFAHPWPHTLSTNSSVSPQIDAWDIQYMRSQGGTGEFIIDETVPEEAHTCVRAACSVETHDVGVSNPIYSFVPNPSTPNPNPPTVTDDQGILHIPSPAPTYTHSVRAHANLFAT